MKNGFINEAEQKIVSQNSENGQVKVEIDKNSPPKTKKRNRGSKNIKELNTSKGESNCENTSVKTDVDLGGNCENDVSPKMNAFQVMMNSRHKSIGRNSPGREMNSSDSCDMSLDKKEVKKSRKSVLENWAEAKGASKRKRNDEEVDKYIEYKLKKRAKHLKKILKIDKCCSDDEVIVKKKNVRTIIDSDNDEEMVEKNNKSPNRIRKSTSTITDLDKSDLRPKQKKTWKLKIKIHNSEDINNGNKIENEKEIDDTKLQIEDKNDSLDAKEHIVDVILETTAGMQNDVIVDKETMEDNENNSNGINCKRALRPRKPIAYCTLEDRDTPSKKNNAKTKPKTVAPVFLKAVPKPKMDPKLVEARRQFLLSGVPMSLKKEMEKQQSIEEIEAPIFPSISHIQQKSPENPFWRLSNPELRLIHEEPFQFQINWLNFKNHEVTFERPINYEFSRLTDINEIKKIVKVIKAQNLDYPVFRVFNSVYNNSGYKVNEQNGEILSKREPKVLKRRGRKKKISLKKNEEVVNENDFKVEETCRIYSMWTEKYRARSSSEIIGNSKAVSTMKEWLRKWSHVTDDLKSKKSTTDSGSEFEMTDCDSRDSAKFYSNTIVLKGPSSSGKSSAAYAVCDELGFSVLEVNASSKRTGKLLLQDLQEATQSHQLHKKENIFSLVKDQKSENSKSKMCVLLIEDIDIVFDQDEGFTAALLQIVATSKRPIILTTTDEPPINIQKIMNNYQIVTFVPLLSVLPIWLQIVCLVEGCYVSRKSLEELLRYNEGDIRSTLLQLQLWVSSGGQLRKDCSYNDSGDVTVTYNDDILTDETNLSDLNMEICDDNNENCFMHHNCIESLGVLEYCKSFNLPVSEGLEVIWWNFPNLLNLPNYSNNRINKLETGNNDALKKLNKEKERNMLTKLSQIYESLAFADVVCSRQRRHCKNLDRRWRSQLKDSLSLGENLNNYVDTTFNNDLVHNLISDSIEFYRRDNDIAKVHLDIAMPTVSERRWYSKQMNCEEKLEGALLQCDYLGRRATSLDYMPTLRAIARSESERAASNMKRRNRFCHYLKELDVQGGDTAYTLACNIFKIND